MSLLDSAIVAPFHRMFQFGMGIGDPVFPIPYGLEKDPNFTTVFRQLYHQQMSVVYPDGDVPDLTLESVVSSDAVGPAPGTVVCAGTGIDSTLGVLYLNSLAGRSLNMSLIHIDYGMEYNRKERGNFVNIAEILNSRFGAGVYPDVFDCSTSIEITADMLPKGYIIPARNGLLAAIGSVKRSVGSRVVLVANYRRLDCDEGATVDKNRKFYGYMTYLLSRLARGPVEVFSPFLHMSKAETLLWFKNAPEWSMEDKIALLDATSSCYHPKYQRCGRCFSCYKRKSALAQINVVEEHHSDPNGDPNIPAYKEREVRKGR